MTGEADIPPHLTPLHSWIETGGIGRRRPPAFQPPFLTMALPPLPLPPHPGGKTARYNSSHGNQSGVVGGGHAAASGHLARPECPLASSTVCKGSSHPWCYCPVGLANLNSLLTDLESLNQGSIFNRPHMHHVRHLSAALLWQSRCFSSCTEGMVQSNGSGTVRGVITISLPFSLPTAQGKWHAALIRERRALHCCIVFSCAWAWVSSSSFVCTIHWASPCAET